MATRRADAALPPHLFGARRLGVLDHGRADPRDHRGYLDVDCARLVVDHKLSGSTKWSQRTADADLQAAAYLLLRSLAGEPAERFEFHLARPRREEVQVIETRRSPTQLAHVEGLIALTARRIARAHESGDGATAQRAGGARSAGASAGTGAPLAED